MTRIHGFLLSTWTRTAVMACIEKGLEYELVPLDRGSAEHAALHPFARMPVLEHDGPVVAETLAITGYIDEAFPGPALQPESVQALRRMREWLSICADYIYRDVVLGIPRRRPATEEELRSARAPLEKIEGLVNPSEYLLGDRLTLADLYLAPQLSNAREKAPEVLSGLDSLSGWLDWIAPRRSFQETSYDLPPG